MELNEVTETKKNEDCSFVRDPMSIDIRDRCVKLNNAFVNFRGVPKGVHFFTPILQHFSKVMFDQRVIEGSSAVGKDEEKEIYLNYNP